VLSFIPKTFKKFFKFRQIRKTIAVKHAVSAYIAFTDAEIAKMQEVAVNKQRNIKDLHTTKQKNIK